MAGFASKTYFLLYIMAVVPAVLCHGSKDNHTTSRATYYSTSDGLGTPSMYPFSLHFLMKQFSRFKNEL